jgi:hypothetical protein
MRLLWPVRSKSPAFPRRRKGGNVLVFKVVKQCLAWGAALRRHVRRRPERPGGMVQPRRRTRFTAEALELLNSASDKLGHGKDRPMANFDVRASGSPAVAVVDAINPTGQRTLR